MNKSVIASVSLLLASVAVAIAADTASMPPMPKPQDEHQWLQRFVGEWDLEGEFTLEPGQPPIKTHGTETVRSLGGFWIISEVKGEFMGQPMQGVMTLGYDPKRSQYVGTWVDSMGDHLWRYEGAVSESGDKLTLESEGPCPMQPGRTAQMKDVTEFQGDDVRVLTTHVQLEDGQWVAPMKMTARRKK